MTDFWLTYQSNVDLAFVGCLFALSIFAGLWSGVFSVAPIGFAAVAAYTSVQLVATVPWLPSSMLPIIGLLVGSSLAYLSSFVFLHLSSHYLALSTIATIVLVRVIALNFDVMTGGVVGIAVPKFVETKDLALILMVVCFVFWRVRRSRLGLSLEAVREHPEVASSIGIDVDRTRRIVFVCSGALGGLAGVLHSQILQYISPDTFYLHLAFFTLAAVVLGGPLHWFGPIVGTFVFALIPEILRPLMGDTTDIGYGLILIMIMLFARRGLVDPRQVDRLSSRIRNVRKAVS